MKSLPTPQGIRKKHGGKFYGKKLKTSFFLLAKQKRTVVYMRCCLPIAPPHESGLQRFFFELKELACASQRDRFQVYNPNENDDTIILRIMDQNEENELLRITQNTDAFTCEVMGNAYFLIKDRPDILKPHPQMTAMINRRYSEIVDYPLPSTLCLNPAGAPTLSVPLDNIKGYLYSEWRKGNLDEWKTQEKVTYLAAKIQSGIEKTTRILQHANISESTQQNAFLETMTMCGLKQIEIPPPHTHIPIEKMVEEVLLADKTFQAFLVTDPSASLSMLAEIIETLSDQVFHAIFRIDPQAIQKMAEEQLTTLHVRSEQQSGCLCCFL
ncbi:secreted effector protein [Salmonella enterica subsp. enterica serovar Montevideo str. 80959-06]|nr:secreted effector protein [Salmonella enterica subsp. enterica serovar Montevideo str. 80959-06]